MSIKQNITSLQNLLEQVNALPEASTGVELPELTNPASASDILANKEAINANGSKITGSIPTKTSSDLTVNKETITVPAGYYDSAVEKSVAIVAQATPVVQIDSSGLVSAHVIQNEGYVSAGAKTETKQLPTQAATTITPSTVAQPAVGSGVYTTGAITVAAIPSKYKDTSTANVVAGDILSGKKGFNANGEVTGTMPNNGTITSTMDGIDVKSVTIPEGYTAGGTVSLDDTIDNEVDTQASLIAQIKTTVNNLPEAGGDGDGGSVVVVDTRFKDLVEGELTEVSDSTITKTKVRAFCNLENLVTVMLPNVTTLNNYTFNNCTALESIDLPGVTTATGTYFCDGCTNLKHVNIPRVSSISTYAFRNCSSLEKLDLGNITALAGNALTNASNLTTLIIRRDATKATTLSTSTLTNTPIVNGTGYVYVPAAMLDTFKNATNWAAIADQIRAIEDYPEICGV